MVDTAYRYVGASRQFCNLKLLLWYSFQGNVCINEIIDDTNFETIYVLSEMDSQYQAQFEVQFVPIIPDSQTSFMDQLRSVTPSEGFVQSQQVVQSHDFFPSTSHNPSSVQFHQPNFDEHDHQPSFDGPGHDTTGGLDDSDDDISEKSDDTRDSFSVDGDVSGDSGNEEVEQNAAIVEPNVGFVHEEDDVHNRLPFDEDEQQWVYWSKENGEIHKGMVFKSKAELAFAVRLWNIKNNREIIIQDTRPLYWKARCYTRSKNYQGTSQQYPCMWTATGSKRNKHGI